jgi:hypothetical protein
MTHPPPGRLLEFEAISKFSDEEKRMIRASSRDSSSSTKPSAFNAGRPPQGATFWFWASPKSSVSTFGCFASKLQNPPPDETSRNKKEDCQ